MSRPTRFARLGARVLTSGLLVVAFLAPLTALTAPARAAAPAPVSPSFTALIDDYARWEPETGCSPSEKPGPQAVRSLLRRTYGTSVTSNIVRGCTSSDSGHEEGRALDWMTNVRVTSQRQMASAFLAWLRATDEHGNAHAMVRRLGIQYIIWNNRMWRAYDPYRGGSSGWTEYSGCLAPKKAARSYDTACHRNHVHLSFNWDGAYQRTSYYTHYVACPTFPTPGAAPALATSGLEFVPVTPARVLGTHSGKGTPAGSCMVKPATRLDVPMLGRGGVPASGVSAVVLRAGLYKPKAATSLRVWATGAPIPRDPVVSARPGDGVGLVTVPVGYGGMVSFQHLSGMSHVYADVVGYYRAPAPGGSLLHPVSPLRVLRSRTVAAGESVDVDLGAASHVAGVTAGLLSVTVTAPTSAGRLLSFQPGGSLPQRESLSFAAGQTTTSSVIARTSASGTTALHNTSAQEVTLTVDLQGVYADARVPGGRLYVPVRQARLVDTRTDVGITNAMTAGRTAAFQVLGKGHVPTGDVAAVLINGMALNPSASTTNTLWANGADMPSVTQLRPRAATPGADMFVVPPGADGMVAVRNSAGTTDMTFDVAGYFR